MKKVLAKAVRAYPALLAVGLLVSAGPPTFAGSPTVIGDGFVSVEVNFDGTGLSLDISTDDGSFDAGTTILLVGDVAMIAQPDDPDYAFLGAGAGNPVWILSQFQTPDLIQPGVDTTGIDRGTFDIYFESDPRINQPGEWVTLSLQAVRGPGVFSVWSVNFGGSPTVWMTSSDPITDSDAYFALTNTDDRLNFGFSAAGMYEIDLQASAMLNGELIQTDVTTYYFQVGES